MLGREEKKEEQREKGQVGKGGGKQRKERIVRRNRDYQKGKNLV